jgi:uncharacterized ubiquitin-like protein YukD
MVDKVIITIRFYEKSIDMEVPANIPVHRLIILILDMLNDVSQVEYGNPSAGRMFSVDLNRYLEDNETLNEAGIWDGSIINIS